MTQKAAQKRTQSKDVRFPPGPVSPVGSTVTSSRTFHMGVVLFNQRLPRGAPVKYMKNSGENTALDA